MAEPAAMATEPEPEPEPAAAEAPAAAAAAAAAPAADASAATEAPAAAEDTADKAEAGAPERAAAPVLEPEPDAGDVPETPTSAEVANLTASPPPPAKPEAAPAPEPEPAAVEELAVDDDLSSLEADLASPAKAPELAPLKAPELAPLKAPELAPLKPLVGAGALPPVGQELRGSVEAPGMGLLAAVTPAAPADTTVEDVEAIDGAGAALEPSAEAAAGSEAAAAEQPTPAATDGDKAEGGEASRMALEITTSPDLTVDTRFTVIVNSVSPEFQSSGSDSGINFSVWKTLTKYSGEGEKPAPIKYDQTAFGAAAGASPTYADVMWSEVPAGAAPEGSALKYIVHALVRLCSRFAPLLVRFCSLLREQAPDLSNRPKRLQSGLSKEEAFAAVRSSTPSNLPVAGGV